MADDEQEKIIGVEPTEKLAGEVVQKGGKVAGGSMKKGSKMAGQAVEKAGEPVGKAIGGAIGLVGGPGGAQAGSDIGGAIGKGAGKIAGKGIEKAGEKTGEQIEKAGEKLAEAKGVEPKEKKQNEAPFYGGGGKTGEGGKGGPMGGNIFAPTVIDEKNRGPEEAEKIAKQAEKLGGGGVIDEKNRGPEEAEKIAKQAEKLGGIFGGVYNEPGGIAGDQSKKPRGGDLGKPRGGGKDGGDGGKKSDGGKTGEGGKGGGEGGPSDGGGAIDKLKAAAGVAKKASEAVGKLSSPEGIIMFVIAAIFDGVGLLGFIPVVGWIIEMVSDIVATFVFSIWMFATGRKGWLKLILAAVIEIVPYLDDIAPFVSLISMVFGVKIPSSWIGFVYSVL